MGGDEEVKPQPQLAILLKSQNVELDALYRSISYIEALPPETRVGPILDNRSKHLYMCWSSVTARHHQLIQVATNDEIKTRSYFKQKFYETAEEKYLTVSDLISVWMTAANPQPQVATQPTLQAGLPTHQSVRLPPLSIPTFSGKLTDWVNFKDTFESLVIGHRALNSLETLHYLKASVQGDALELICNVPLLATNFEIAWNLLKTRYSNNRDAVNAHINEIFSVETIKKESATSLLNLRNVVKRNLAALQNLNRPVDNYGDILINRLVESLDSNTQRDWELTLASTTECPTYEDFDNFLLTRIRALEAVNHVENTIKSNQNKQISTQNKSNVSRNRSIVANSYVVSNEDFQCAICKENHKIYKCSSFQNLSPLDRYDKIKVLQLCTNCLSSSHKVYNCGSKHTCHECRKKHHTLLHRDNSKQNRSNSIQTDDKNAPSISTQAEANNVQSHFLTTETFEKKRVLLATVKLCVMSNSNRKIQVRALLDQGSTWSFVSNKLANALNAKRHRVSATLSGLSGTSAGTASSVIELNLCPVESESPMFRTQALVIPRITTYIPEKRVALESWPHLKNLEFSDNLTSDEEINMLIRADLYGGLILNEIRKGG